MSGPTRTRAWFVFAVVAVVAAVAAISIAVWRGRSSNGTPSVAIIGDSITVNSADDLSRVLEPEYDVDIRAQSGRRIDEMLPALRTALSAHPRGGGQSRYERRTPGQAALPTGVRVSTS